MRTHAATAKSGKCCLERVTIFKLYEHENLDTGCFMEPPIPLVLPKQSTSTYIHTHIYIYKHTYTHTYIYNNLGATHVGENQQLVPHVWISRTGRKKRNRHGYDLFHSLNVKQWVSFSQIGVPQRSVRVGLCFQYTPIYPEYDKSYNNLHFSGQSKIIPKLRQAYFGANFFTKCHLWGLASVTSLASRGGINVPTH